MKKYSTTYLIAAYAMYAAVTFMTLALPVVYVARKVSAKPSAKSK